MTNFLVAQEQVEGEQEVSGCPRKSPSSLIHQIRSRSQPFFSVEFFPPRSPSGGGSFVRLLDRYLEGCPLFCDITWHANGRPEGDTITSSVVAAGIANNTRMLQTMLHIICVGMSRQQISTQLTRAKNLGIRNILALRGDLKENQQTTDFHYAVDLVRFIRAEFGSYFTIGVAGYPIPHPDAPSSRELDIHYLKQKVDSGADFIITQLFFRSADYFRFREECHASGITVPIIPGICAINNFRSVVRFAELSSVPIPDDLYRKLEAVKEDDEAVRSIGVEFLTDLCKELLFPVDGEEVPGLHFYTLNQTCVIQVIANIGLWGSSVDLPFQSRDKSSFPLFSLNTRDVYHSSDDHIPHPVDATKLSSILTSESSSLPQLFHIFYEGLSQPQPEIATLAGIFHSLANRKWMQECYERLGRFMSKGLMVLNYIPRIESTNTDQYECVEFLLEKSLSERFIDECLTAEFASKHRQLWIPFLSYPQEEESAAEIGHLSIRRSMDDETGSWEERIHYDDCDFREAHSQLKTTIDSWIAALKGLEQSDSVAMLDCLSLRHFVIIRSDTQVSLEDLFGGLFKLESSSAIQHNSA